MSSVQKRAAREEGDDEGTTTTRVQRLTSLFSNKIFSPPTKTGESNQIRIGYQQILYTIMDSKIEIN